MALSFPLPARLGSFYFLFFAYSAAYVAYFPLYLAGRGLEAGAIALVLAAPQVLRIVAPAGWGWLADRFGAQRGIVVAACASMAGFFPPLALLPGPPALPGVGGLPRPFSPRPPPPRAGPTPRAP